MLTTRNSFSDTLLDAYFALVQKIVSLYLLQILPLLIVSIVVRIERLRWVLIESSAS